MFFFSSSATWPKVASLILLFVQAVFLAREGNRRFRECIFFVVIFCSFCLDACFGCLCVGLINRGVCCFISGIAEGFER